MQQILAFAFEARGAVGHHPFALSCPDLATEVRLAGLAELAFTAFGRASHSQRITPMMEAWRD